VRPILLLFVLFALVACAHAAPRADADPRPAAIDYSCRVAADCAIKDVGNCCGRYPACVNRDSPTFPERVKEECQRKGMAGVCGFPVIHGCACIEGRCEGADGGGGSIR
jgi:hypothetical protein